MFKRLTYGEFVLALLVASLFWITVLGWATSYAPTDPQKDACYQSAAKSGRNVDECKSFWEKTTSDPISAFTLILAVSTVGLWAATIGLYFAGEKQAAISLKTANAAERNAEALISTERAHLFVIVRESSTAEALRGARFFDNSPTMRDSQLPIAGLGFVIKNTGRTAAIMSEVSYQFIQASHENVTWEHTISDTIVNPVVEGGSETAPPTPCTMESRITVADGRDAIDGTRPLFFYGYVKFRDTFKREITYYWRYQYRGRRFVLVHEEEYVNTA